MNRGDLIVVFWWDVEDESAWQSLVTIEQEKLPLCKSVGWFLSEDASSIRILFSVSGTEDTKIEAGRTLIPKALIRNIELIREDELDTE